MFRVWSVTQNVHVSWGADKYQRTPKTSFILFSYLVLNLHPPVSLTYPKHGVIAWGSALYQNDSNHIDMSNVVKP